MAQPYEDRPSPTIGLSLATQLQHGLSRLERVVLAIVFGSAASGQLRFDSDLYIKVNLDHAMSVSKKISLIEALAEQTGRAIDMVDLYDTPESLLGQILQHGYRLLGRQNE